MRAAAAEIRASRQPSLSRRHAVNANPVAQHRTAIPAKLIPSELDGAFAGVPVVVTVTSAETLSALCAAVGHGTSHDGRTSDSGTTAADRRIVPASTK